jgi:hypothetical protein
MRSLDTINALFEAGGAAAIWKSVFVLRHDRQVKGVYWPASIFYSLWGLWNLVYYPSLSQWWSAGAGAVLVTGNIAWVVLAIRYRRPEEGTWRA